MPGTIRGAACTLSVVRAFLVCLTTMLASLVFAGPASAHARLLGTAPADGATVVEPMGAVILEFNQLVGVPELAINGPDGQPLPLEPLPSEGQRLVQPLPPLTQTGSYTVTWRVISLDRDPVDGQFSFTYTGPLAPRPEAAVTSPAPSEPAAPSLAPPEAAEPELVQPAAEEPSASAVLWPLVLLAVVAIAVIPGAAVWLLRRRRSESP